MKQAPTKTQNQLRLKRRKTLVVLLASLIISLSTQSLSAQVDAIESRSGWVSSMAHAIESSTTTQRPIMLVFSGSDWCVWCQRLDAEVFQTAEFANWSNRNVIKVMVDFPHSYNLTSNIAQQNEYLKKYFNAYVTAYPTVLMIKADGSVIGKTGYVAGGPEAWIATADPMVNSTPFRLADSGLADGN